MAIIHPPTLLPPPVVDLSPLTSKIDRVIDDLADARRHRHSFEVRLEHMERTTNQILVIQN